MISPEYPYELKMKIYLDMCVYNRPFDYQGDEKIVLETNAFIYILEKIEKGEYELVCSEILLYENNKNPDLQRKVRITSYFSLAKEFVKIEKKDIERVKVLKKFGFCDIDAFHIAMAEKSKVNYFITCDKEIINIYRNNKRLIKTIIVGILEFISLDRR